MTYECKRQQDTPAAAAWQVQPVTMKQRVHNRSCEGNENIRHDQHGFTGIRGRSRPKLALHKSKAGGNFFSFFEITFDYWCWTENNNNKNFVAESQKETILSYSALAFTTNLPFTPLLRSHEKGKCQSWLVNFIKTLCVEEIVLPYS